MDLGEVEVLLREGWRPYVQRKGKYAYVVLRKRNLTRSVGPYTEGLWREVLRLAGRLSEKGVPRGAERGNLFPRAVPRWEGNLEEAEAGSGLVTEEVPPEVDLFEVELAERRRRMFEEAKLELEKLHLERLKRLLETRERRGEPPQLDLQLLTLCALAARNPWEALVLYFLCLGFRQLLQPS
jgi:hypothetical protein